MALPVRLKNVVDALEMVDDFVTSHINRNTGEIVEVIREDPFAAGEPEPDPTLGDVSSDEFVALPNKFQIHEWSIMERFAQSQANRRIREDLLDAIHGRGAFRQFKAITARRGIREAWDAFRRQALTEIAIEFLEDNQIPHVRE